MSAARCSRWASARWPCWAGGRNCVPLALAAGYLPAWVGHFFFEHNAPATFRHPLYSLRGDFTMLFATLSGRMRW